MMLMYLRQHGRQGKRVGGFVFSIIFNLDSGESFGILYCSQWGIEPA